MAYFVAILTPDSTRSHVIQSTFPTKGMRSIISTVSISLEGFLASILLLMVVIVAAVIVMVIRVVVVVVIVREVIVVAIIGVIVVVTIIGIVIVVRFIGIVVVVGGVPFIIKLLFVIIVQAILLACSIPMGWAYAFYQDKASSVKVPVANVTLFSSAQLLRENTDSVHSNQRMRISLGLVFLLGLSAFAMAAACASRAAVTPSVISCRMAASVIVGAADVDVDLTSDEDPTDEDGGTGMGDSTGVSMSLGDEISLGGKKSQKSNISGGEIDSEDKRSLVKSSKESGEMFPGVTGEIAWDNYHGEHLFIWRTILLWRTILSWKTVEYYMVECKFNSDWATLLYTRKIIVVILVRDRCPRGKGNLARLPIRTNIVRLATPSIGELDLEDKGSYVTRRGHVGGL
ncbi:hypothetical protein Tco_1370922 [Tanacetum coccineum]